METANNNFWENKRVFVTGGIGFLGSWLVKELVEKGAHVVVLTGDNEPRSNFYRMHLDKKVIVVQGYLQDYQLMLRVLKEYDIQVVFHLAAQPIVTVAYRDPFNTFESNIRGTYNVLEACRNHKVEAVIVASSDKAYGSHEELPYKEHAPLKGEYPYDVSKSCTDLIANCYYKTYNLPVVVTRSANFYGGGDFQFTRMVPKVVTDILKGKRPVTRSDGEAVRDYVHVRDIVDAYLKLAENIYNPNVVGQAFNIGTGKKYTDLYMINTILKLMNSDLEPVILNEAKAEIKDQYLSVEKIKNIIGWEHKYDLEIGLRDTIAWYKGFFSLEGASVLVTGGTGFIGKHLVNKLIGMRAKVSVISRNNLSLDGVNSYKVDLIDKENLRRVVKEINPKIVFHLGATIDRDPENRDQIIETNFKGTVNLVEALEGINYTCFVYTSTAEVYAGRETPFVETMAPQFNSSYSESKAMAENYCNEQIRKGKPIVILRPFILYGPGQKAERLLIPRVMKACFEGREFDTNKGEVTRDFVYVEDACDAFISAALSPRAIGHTINICSGEEMKIVDVSNIINNLWGNPIKINFGKIPYRDMEIWSYYGDLSKAKDFLVWQPKTTLLDGLTKTMQWYKTGYNKG